MVAPYFPPRRRVGSLRPFKFAMHLREFGWTPTVVCLATPGARLTERERSHLEGIELIELDSPLDRTRGGASTSDHQTPPVRAASTALARWGDVVPGALERPLRRVVRNARALADRADQAIPVDTWWPVLRVHQPRLESLVHQRGFDVVWSTGDPWSAHVLARALAKGPGPALSALARWTGRPAERQVRPWVADFRDPWTLCASRNAGRPWATRVVDEQVERLIFQTADALTFTADVASERYREHYAGFSPDVRTIVNGFDRGFFGAEAVARGVDVLTSWPSDPGAPFELLFFGRFRPLSPARPVIAMLAQLRRIAPEVFGQVRVRSIAPLGDADRDAATEAGVDEAFETTDPVAYEDALPRLRKADVLLVSSSAERDDMIPAKLWDYLPAGRPILSLAANREVKQVLRRTGRGRHVGSTSPLLAARLVAQAVQARDAGVPPGWIDLERAREQGIDAYEAKALTQTLAELLDEKTASSPS